MCQQPVFVSCCKVAASAWTELENTNPDIATQISNRRAQAFIHRGKRFDILLSEDKWTEYGVIVAQKQPSGRVFLVVAGQSGRSTLATALMIDAKGMQEYLPEADEAILLYAVVKVPIKLDINQSAADNRGFDLEEIDFVQSAKLWQVM